GDVDEIYSNDGTTWHGGNVVSVGSNKLTTGQQLAIAELSDGGVELFGMGVSGYIIQVQKSGGSWGPYETYGGFVPSSSVSEYVSTSPFVMQVVGLGTDGNLYVAEYDGSWNEYNIG
ncbi:MAG TPA: hypothetical protein VFI31_05840, partial [Pirellulales bacterium]|nr:hypothetical protein [Pirellulales bacterium]